MRTFELHYLNLEDVQFFICVRSLSCRIKPLPEEKNIFKVCKLSNETDFSIYQGFYFFQTSMLSPSK